VSFAVLWHSEAEEELGSIEDARERVAIVHAGEKLKAVGRLPSPHSSAVRGSA